MSCVRTASSGDQELFAGMTMFMSYVTFFAMLVVGAFCLSYVAPPRCFSFRAGTDSDVAGGDSKYPHRVKGRQSIEAVVVQLLDVCRTRHGTS